MEKNFSSAPSDRRAGPTAGDEDAGAGAEVRERLAVLEALSRTLVHEIRNHLSTVRMSMYLLESADGVREEDREHFRIARDGILRIEGVLRSLVTVSRPVEPRPTPSDLVSVVQSGLEEARDVLVRSSVSVFRQFPDPPPILPLDPGLLSRAVAHVARNAAEAVPSGGTLHVAIKPRKEEDARWWVVEFRDNGPGVPPDLRERVFDPCFTTKEHRMGLGLTAARRLMAAQGGTVTLSSEPGGGAVVTLLVPDRRKEGRP